MPYPMLPYNKLILTPELPVFLAKLNSIAITDIHTENALLASRMQHTLICNESATRNGTMKNANPSSIATSC